MPSILPCCCSLKKSIYVFHPYGFYFISLFFIRTQTKKIEISGVRFIDVFIHLLSTFYCPYILDACYVALKTSKKLKTRKLELPSVLWIFWGLNFFSSERQRSLFKLNIFVILHINFVHYEKRAPKGTAWNFLLCFFMNFMIETRTDRKQEWGVPLQWLHEI